MKIVLLLATALLAASCGGGQDNADPHTLRRYANAHELYARGHFTQSAELLEGIKRFPPAMTLRGKAHYFSGDLDTAQRSFRQTLRERPGNFEAKLYLARILREQGEGDKARQMANDLLADNPRDIRLLRLAASIAMDQGSPAEASAFLDQAAEMTADGALVLLDRARLRWIAGNGAEALEDLARARAMLPWDSPVARSISQLENRIQEAMQ